jgi:cytidylate kinase
VVAPHAALKVYLDARPEVRARRRAGEGKGVQAHRVSGAEAPGADVLSQVQAALEHRDALDNQTNQLRASDGAVHIDTSDLTLPEVVAAVIGLAEQAGVR